MSLHRRTTHPEYVEGLLWLQSWRTRVERRRGKPQRTAYC
jgi:hypothetical protein